MRAAVGPRIGVVGCGRQGLVLAKAVMRSGSLRLVAGADPDTAAAERLAALDPQVRVFDTVNSLLSAVDVDAVLVATTHDALAPVALAAIRSGKHVLVEKPVALTAEQAREIEFAAASAGVVCMAGYSFRYGMARALYETYASGVAGT